MCKAPGPGGGCTLFALRKQSRLLGRLPGESQGQVTPGVSGGREHPARPERVLKGSLLPQGSLLDEEDLYLIGQYAGALRFYRLQMVGSFQTLLSVGVERRPPPPGGGAGPLLKECRVGAGCSLDSLA